MENQEKNQKGNQEYSQERKQEHKQNNGLELLKKVIETNERNTEQGIKTEFVNILSTPMVGASGAIFGVIAAFSLLYPNAEMFIMFIPFPIKAKVLFPITIIVSLYLGFSGSGGNIAHFAHIGGALVGYILIKIWGRNGYRIN